MGQSIKIRVKEKHIKIRRTRKISNIRIIRKRREMEMTGKICLEKGWVGKK